MILLSRALVELLDEPDMAKIRQALQAALRLEHATMPPYLYALYSLGSANSVIRRLLAAVVREEMLHMLLVGNMLKAVGGTPLIADPAFPMAYPGPLPGAVASSLTVSLRPYSAMQVEQVFMGIEQPEQTIDFPIELDAFAGSAATIGEFYGRLRQLFEEQGDALIVDTTGTGQPEAADFNEPQKILCAADAIRAIDLIVRQGEGTASEPTMSGAPGAGAELAHYYRFAQLVRGRLKRRPGTDPDTPPEDRYFYDAADPFPFDAAAVVPLADDPAGATYPEGSDAKRLNDMCSRTYTRILHELQQAFGGTPSRLDDAIGSMTILSEQAGELAEVPLGNGRFAGPTFEYLE